MAAQGGNKDQQEKPKPKQNKQHGGIHGGGGIQQTRFRGSYLYCRDGPDKNTYEMIIGGKFGSKPSDGDNAFMDSHKFICAKKAQFIKGLKAGNVEIVIDPAEKNFNNENYYEVEDATNH